MPLAKINPSSFRDPSGFVFSFKNSVYRQVSKSYKNNYDALIKSGLYKQLQAKQLLISHQEVSSFRTSFPNAYKILKPQPVSFISYPYEWCFSQLKDAALTTLEIQKTALKFNFTLKDASAYNIQFVGGKPLLIDTLSFEPYTEGEPWRPYRQFCQHFLAPLILAKYRDVRLISLLRIYLDGIPLDLTARLLPARTRLSPSLLLHIHLHALAQSRVTATGSRSRSVNKFNKKAVDELIESLHGAIANLSLPAQSSLWLGYYQDNSYSHRAFDHKVQIIKKLVVSTEPKKVWDLGANTGVFSRLTSSWHITTIAFDNDPLLIESAYQQVKLQHDRYLMPLVMDLTNPSPTQGFKSEERMSLIDRGPADMVLALALIHHLSISYNINFDLVAKFLSQITKWLIIEFVPKTDAKVIPMLFLRQGMFGNYSQENFETEFTKLFTIKQRIKIKDSRRLIYLMRKK